MSDNLKLWQSVEKTDPKYTKAFTKGGGFSGTAINATYLIHKATELWGPMGGTWGPEIVDEKYVPGAEGTIIHVLRINLRHPHGSVPSFGQTTFVGTNKNGLFTDEEAPKKSLTDATTKALSMLGFSADVFLGLYDDNKYVNDRKQEFSKNITPVAGSLAALTSIEQELAKGVAADIVHEWVVNDNQVAAYELFYEAGHTNEMKLGIWECLQPNSKVRNGIKKISQANQTNKLVEEDKQKAANA
jgi:hypothetical protein